jgi:ribosomal protein S6--L-glutamate ligase
VGEPYGGRAVRLTVLSRSLSVPSTARLVAAARARGHAVRVLDPVQVEMHLDGTRGQLLYRRRKLALPDVVLPRIAQSITPYGLAVVNQFGMLGVPVMNTAGAIAHAGTRCAVCSCCPRTASRCRRRSWPGPPEI